MILYSSVRGPWLANGAYRRSLRAKYGGSVTLNGCLIPEFAPAIKPRMRRKCSRAAIRAPCANVMQNGNESHSTLACAVFNVFRADAVAGVPAHDHAWCAACQYRACIARGWAGRFACD